MTTYTWTDNAMRSGSTCDVDKVADNLMHLKYNASSGIQMGSCSTASAIAEKTVTLDNFVLAREAMVVITFANANTATSPTLNVNSTGAKTIYFNDGIAVDATHPAPFNLAGRTVTFIYDGTNWVINQKAIYDSGWFAVAASSTYTKTHNLGTTNIKYIVLIADDSSGTNQRPANDTCYGSTWVGWLGGAVTSSTLSVVTNNQVGFNINGYGQTSAFYKILAEVL